MKYPITLLLAIAVCMASPVAQSAETMADHCRKLYRLTDLDYAIEPGVMMPATNGIAAHCRVRGVVNRAIRFEVTLPINNWNHRMMFSAVGGDAGMIGDTTSLLSAGYAMASTDAGHEITEGHGYYNQPEALLDYAYRGVHLATTAAKMVIGKYYNDEVDYSYINGCSSGGRAVMLEAIRFPEDYDGIIAGAPTFQFMEMIPWMIGVHRAQTLNPLTSESFDILNEASTAACDMIDGVADGVIGDPRQCTTDIFNVDSLVCKNGEKKGCLTPGQVETAKYVYQDMVDEKGKVLSPGVMPGAEAAGDWAFWMLPNEQFDGQSIIGSIGEMLTRIMRFEPGFNVDEFDPIADRAVIANATSPLDVRSSDLSEFRDRGGKLLMYQGWNDWALRPQRAIDYTAAVDSTMGSADKTREFYRMFMVPGMTHCAGGPGAWEADYVTPLVAWREQGKAPDRIIAKHLGNTETHLTPYQTKTSPKPFTRPLCAYPEVAEYRGRGDKDDAASFSCR